MDPVRNPYAPGAGIPPPELAGRDQLRAQVRVATQRIRVGNPAKSIVMVGLRGVGKTVLLERMRREAEADGIETLRLEVAEGQSLPALLAPQLRLILHRLSRVERAGVFARRALQALAGFAKALKVKYNDIEVGIDLEPEAGLADNGDLQEDLSTLLLEVGRTARAAGTAAVLFADELQYLEEDQFAALIRALHLCSQANLPFTLVGAGLPQLRMLAGNAKSYAERLFDFPEIGALSQAEARLALAKPAQALGVTYQEAALEAIIAETRGYPYFLQEWGKYAWETAADTPITLRDVQAASAEALAALDQSFFRVRFDRLTPNEKRYLRAMAELGEGPHRSGDIAEVLGKRVNAFGPLRQGLILKGMIWSPSHGDTAFTVPLFDRFMRRIMPMATWRLLP